ncbi:family 10 glycosylhydrolase [Parabacteroides sp. PF5-9]|uniref:glycoside hydrolase family 10 protein n=1 Tax=Parabacteroides sp. PF5-9 TaxID=1742404 RepID=UPI002473DA13|nr:family 10 glycosylhydrolase [Parabacteroides sp. PF5-9]MDH6357172.1 uncharacterized lipoprotein YddW (UPF0748 family) [Parabacteroides sp. PF5-9]
MTGKQKNRKYILYWGVVLCCCFFINTPLYSEDSLPVAVSPKQEIRAVWLTTIYGLDWPHKPAATEAEAEKQQNELIAILDRLREANFNMVFLQVRQRGDVIYNSKIEPISRVISGKYGVESSYDPLAFAVEECHKRGMECHAWFVTFPVGTPARVRAQGSKSVVKRHPELCKLHKEEWYLDPGVSGTGDYILSLVQEVVDGYDIDGVHFDYIRYPEGAETFPDKKEYEASGKNMKLADWRRENINKIVARVYDWVKEVKPWVQVSSSPLGKYSRIEKVPNAGWTAFETVFQDPISWIGEGKQDMIVPMMYYKNNNFFPFVEHWAENTKDRLFVPGLGVYRMEAKDSNWAVDDIIEQLDYVRNFGSSGCAFFRCSNVFDNTKGLYDRLKDTYFKYPAQLPPLTWLSDSIPSAPQEIVVERLDDKLKLTWQEPDSLSESLTYTIYYTQSDSIDLGSSQAMIATGVRDTVAFIPIDPETEKLYTFCVTASNRYRLESVPSRETFYYLSEFVK